MATRSTTTKTRKPATTTRKAKATPAAAKAKQTTEVKVSRKPGQAAGREIKLTKREEGGQKECNTCHQKLEATAEHFYVRPNGTLNAWCRHCNADKDKAARQRKGEAAKAAA